MEAFRTSAGEGPFLESDFFLPLPSQLEMAAMDRLTIESGVPSDILMERAGKAIFAALEEHARFQSLRSQTVLVLCGPGNNGGDGLVIAGELFAAGKSVLAVLTNSAKGYSKDYLLQLSKYLAAGGKAVFYSGSGTQELNPPLQDRGLARFEHLPEFSDCLVIDALLGTGQKSSPRGAIADLLNELAEPTLSSSPFKVSVDLPTGLNGDTGEVYSPCFKADVTLCVQYIKRGLLQAPARAMSGEIKTVGIGLKSQSCEFSMITPLASRLIPKRPADSHKGMFGKVFIIGGSRNMPGASVLAAKGALTAGAGIVIKAHLSCFNSVAVPPEVILSCSSDDSAGVWQRCHLKDLKRGCEEVDTVVLGPGLGQERETSALVTELLEWFSAKEKKVVIDADALNIIAADPLLFSLNLKNMVLTPHPGEMARLLGMTVAEVQRNRYLAVSELHKKTGATILLKGASSLIYGANQYSKEPAGVVSTSGNPYMASPGMGDFLSGVIATLMAQGYLPPLAAALAALLHGQAGDKAYAGTGGPLRASSLSDFFWS